MSTATEIIVPAAERWFHTGFTLEKGARYRVTVPLGQVWSDWYVANGPQGSTTFLQKPFRHCLRLSPARDPRAAFFTLVGTIGESLQNAFVIGAGPCDFTAAASGEFVCFANDIWLVYWNNHGSMRLTIVRTS